MGHMASPLMAPAVSGRRTPTRQQCQRIQLFWRRDVRVQQFSGYIRTGLIRPFAIALDGSGNLWAASQGGGIIEIVEFIGVATPVITPIAAGLPATPTTDGSSNLGTRP